MKTIDINLKYNTDYRHGWGKPPHPRLFDILEANKYKYSSILYEFSRLNEFFHRIDRDAPADTSQPFWTNVWLPPFDAISLYGFIAINRPEIYIEIGSGNSTKFARRAISDHNLKTKIVSIDPNPRAEIDQICDTVIRKPLQNVELSIFDVPEDSVVFLDGSHRTLQNSDVTVFFTEILPDLKKNTIVGIHDIFLPNDYPPHWMNRFYSEQYMLACCVLFGGEYFETIMPVAHISRTLNEEFPLRSFFDSELMKDIKPSGGAFWMRMKMSR